MCKSDESAGLGQHVVDKQSTPYFPISHIWTNASWQDGIPGIGWRVIVSPQKAKSLAEITVGYLSSSLPNSSGWTYYAWTKAVMQREPGL